MPVHCCFRTFHYASKKSMLVQIEYREIPDPSSSCDFWDILTLYIRTSYFIKITKNDCHYSHINLQYTITALKDFPTFTGEGPLLELLMVKNLQVLEQFIFESL